MLSCESSVFGVETAVRVGSDAIGEIPRAAENSAITRPRVVRELESTPLPLQQGSSEVSR